jgi:low affinity Fe/Cu permease
MNVCLCLTSAFFSDQDTFYSFRNGILLFRLSLSPLTTVQFEDAEGLIDFSHVAKLKLNLCFGINWVILSVVYQNSTKVTNYVTYLGDLKCIWTQLDL